MATLQPPAARLAASGLLRSPPSISRSFGARHTALQPVTAVRHKSGPYGYTQAKALVFSKYGEPSDVLKLHTHSISPTLPDGAVLLRTLAAPINPADVNTVQGTYGAKPTFTNLIGTADPSAVPGNEACFEVVARGSGVASLRRGDWVIPARTGFGTWRTHALVERAEASLLKVRDADAGTGAGGQAGDITPLQAATVSVNPCSAYRLLRDFVDLIGLSVRSYSSGDPASGGAWFLQNGANSGVGRAAIQLGRHWGLRSINVVRERPTPAETDALKDELRALGATVVVTERELLDRGFAARVKEEWTRGGRDPVMLGLNCVGGKSATALARCVSDGGTVVTYGAMSKQPVALPTGLLIFRDLRFRGFWLSRWADADREAKKRTVDEILGLIREGKFSDVPSQEIRWDWGTDEKVLKEAVQGTLEGFRAGKGVFMFGDT